MEDKEAKRKRMKWMIGIIAFVIFQVIQALFFVLVIMKFKSPQVQVRIKNTNWGPFKYDASTVNFIYGGVQVGQLIIPDGKANFKSTKKINVNVTLSSANLPSDSNLGSDLSCGS
ncbi:hypothetical protein NL676_010120 [Syzygium grande]|nr:hypothetical protein NL676_010120 [Syzygium grande]